MSNFLFAVLLCVILVAVVFYKNITAYLFRFCHVSKKASSTLKSEDVNYGINEHMMASENFGFPFLERIGYFLASNDDRESFIGHPTALQDTEPKDFA